MTVVKSNIFGSKLHLYVQKKLVEYVHSLAAAVTN